MDDYIAWARRKGLSLTHIVDTHIHADHLSGNQALAAKTGARIHIHPAAEAAFPHAPIADGDEITIGTVRIQVIHTPGHTPDSICLLVTDLSRGEEPWFVLTGDTLFVGDVGRPDFGGERAAANLYESLTTRVLTLPDSVEVYPAHGAGSSCGRAMSSKPGSTIGFERRFNPALQARTADEFVSALMTGLPPKPPGFDRIIAKNRSQALPSSGDPEPLSVAQAREAMAKGAVVLDVRSPGGVRGGAHSRRRQRVDREQSLRGPRGHDDAARQPLRAGGDRARPISPARCRGWAAPGMDDIAGYLQRGMTDWKSEGLPEARVPQITVHDLATMRDERPDLVVRGCARALRVGRRSHRGRGQRAHGAGHRAHEGAPGRPAQGGALRGRPPLELGDQRAPAGRNGRLVQCGRWHARVDARQVTPDRPSDAGRHERRLRLPDDVEGADPGRQGHRRPEDPGRPRRSPWTPRS